jgi:hypothetical protein
MHHREGALVGWSRGEGADAGYGEAYGQHACGENRQGAVSRLGPLAPLFATRCKFSGDRTGLNRRLDEMAMNGRAGRHPTRSAFVGQ